MLPAGTDLQYESSVSSFEDELLENIRPNLISLTLSGSFSSHFDSDNKSFKGDLLLSNNKEVNNSLDSFTVILNPCANDEVEVSSLKSYPNNSQNSFKNVNIIKAPSVNTINEQKSSLPLDYLLPQSKKWTSLHDLDVKVPSVSGPSHSATTVCSVTKSKDSGLTKTPSRLSLFGTSKCFGDSHMKDEKYNETVHQRMNERTASSSIGNNGESELVDILQKELKLKDNIIEQIQQNYLDLLKKYAEAENKIDKLRIKVIHPSSEDFPTTNSIKNFRSTSKYLHQNTSQIKNENVPHRSFSKCVNSQFPHLSHGPIAASTPVLNEYIANSNEVENIVDVTENSILKVKRWQKSLPSFNQEMHCFEDASKLDSGITGKMKEESFHGFYNQYNSRKNEYNPIASLDFLGENNKKIRSSDSSQNCYRTRKCGSISCIHCKERHAKKICSEECAKKSVRQLECLKIEPCSCWNGDSELLNNTDQDEMPTLCCPVPPLELSTSSSSSGHQSAEEFKYSHKFTSVSGVSNSTRSQKITLNTKDPYTVNYSKCKKPIPNSDNTSTSYCTLQLNKPVEGVGSDTCQKTLSPTVKRALLNFLLNDAFCCHEVTKQVETHSCGINTDSPAHITSPESAIKQNKNSVDLGKCLDEVNKIANLLKLQSANIVKEVTRHMQPQLP